MERIPPHINNSSQQGHHEHEHSPYFQGVSKCYLITYTQHQQAPGGPINTTQHTTRSTYFPMPMRAVPASPMMVRTSAKSTLIRPGRMIISLMPTTPAKKVRSGCACERQETYASSSGIL
jgi:hypothetical protein